MDNQEKRYRNLQLHLDKETIGFPEAKTGADILLLQQLFTPEQAEITMLLTYRYQSLEQILMRAKEIGKSEEETARLLKETADRGVIGFRVKDGVPQFKTIPYLVGMLEGAAMTTPPELKPKLMEAHVKFSADGGFIEDFINTKIPQMRTIPIQKSIAPEHQVGSYDEVRKIIESTTDPIVIVECVCRKGAENAGQPCKRTARKETCMIMGDMARNITASGTHGRSISKEEALEIMRQNQEDGLVLQPSNSQIPGAICSCCGCCCGLLKLHKYIPDPVSHWAANFYAAVDAALCTGCGVCQERCQVDAMKMTPDGAQATVNLARCLGCGLCVVACPMDAIELLKKESELVPPLTMDDTMEYIMTHKS